MASADDCTTTNGDIQEMRIKMIERKEEQKCNTDILLLAIKTLIKQDARDAFECIALPCAIPAICTTLNASPQ